MPLNKLSTTLTTLFIVLHSKAYPEISTARLRTSLYNHVFIFPKTAISNILISFEDENPALYLAFMFFHIASFWFILAKCFLYSNLEMEGASQPCPVGFRNC